MRGQGKLEEISRAVQNHLFLSFFHNGVHVSRLNAVSASEVQAYVVVHFV